MKKYVIISFLFSLIIFFSICVYVNYYSYDNQNIIENKKIIERKSSISMMFEMEENSGEYIESSASTWFTDGYTFNETLSKCENGGELIWDDVNKKVLIKSSGSEKCYIYFDKNKSLSGYQVSSATDADGYFVNVSNFFWKTDGFYKEINEELKDENIIMRLLGDSYSDTIKIISLVGLSTSDNSVKFPIQITFEVLDIVSSDVAKAITWNEDRHDYEVLDVDCKDGFVTITVDQL